jgi:hypothetical protein
MYLDQATQQQYPNFTNYIKADFPVLTHNRPIIYGLKKWGKMSELQARQYLSWGNQPMIKVADFTPSPTIQISEFPSAIKLQTAMVSAFEGRDKLSRTEVTSPDGTVIPPQYPVWHNSLGKSVHIIGVEILNLLVHGHVRKYSPVEYKRKMWWDWEQGFNRDVYGGIRD